MNFICVLETAWISLPGNVSPLCHQEKITTLLITDLIMYLIFFLSTVNTHITNILFNEIKLYTYIHNLLFSFNFMVLRSTYVYCI